jgi:hypothetical protein
MTAGRVTRRTLLLATAGAAAARLSRPAVVLAALGGPPPSELRDLRVGSLTPAGRTIDLGRSADLLGVQWHTPVGARVELRFRLPDGRWSPWQSAGAVGHGPDRQRVVDAIVGDPVWSGGTSVVQLRADRPLGGVRLHLIDASGGIGARRMALAGGGWSRIGESALAATLPRAGPLLSAGPGQPPIIARRAWARGRAHPRVAPIYGAVRMAFVHHTENPNGYLPREVPAMLRAIFAFHRYVHGWNDIGYNFVIDAFGRIFEARAGGIDEPVVGAQAGGYNLVSTGVAVLGSFTSRPISTPARQALQSLLAWKLALHGVPAEGRVAVRVNPEGAPYSRFPANALVSLPRIAGHRDADTTDCPGDALYRELPAIRAKVLRMATRPARATLALGEPSAPETEAGPMGASPATLVGTLAFLDGTPIAGATILIQARSVVRRGELVREQTLARALTDGAGRWSLPIGLTPVSRGGISLRVLYAGARARVGPTAGATGATVSDPLFLAAALSAAPAPAPTQPAAPAPRT